MMFNRFKKNLDGRAPIDLPERYSWAREELVALRLANHELRVANHELKVENMRLRMDLVRAQGGDERTVLTEALAGALGMCGPAIEDEGR